MEQQDAIPFTNLRDHLENRAGDKEFMLKVLAHINQKHYFFGKDYKPPKKTAEQCFDFGSGLPAALAAALFLLWRSLQSARHFSGVFR